MKDRLEIASRLLGLWNVAWSPSQTAKYVVEALDIADMLIEIEANKLRCADVKCGHPIREHAKGACRTKTALCLCQGFLRLDVAVEKVEKTK